MRFDRVNTNSHDEHKIIYNILKAISAMSFLTIEQHQARIRGLTSGFDYLRVFLSVAVLCWHSYLITHGLQQTFVFAADTLHYASRLILPMFFALSGFLVAGSLLRNSLQQFLWLRVVRLVPALAVEVVLSALILGPIVTIFTLDKYFHDPLFFTYFWNTIGHIQFFLPGVFLDHPFARVVNTSLWTVPYELLCYIALTLASLVTLFKRPRIFAVIFVIAVVVKTVLNLKYGSGVSYPPNLGGRQLVVCFLAGVLLYINRDIIPYSSGLALLAAITGYIFVRNYDLVFLSVLPLAYVTVWLGLLNPGKLPIVFTGDYSYGVYLYAAPIQQAVFHFTAVGKSYAGNVVLTLISVCFFAAFSWHAIERPALKLKNLFLKKKQPAPAVAV